jgi:hypothetical protein
MPMGGFIQLRHVLRHPVHVIRGFGCRAFLRCILRAHRGNVTFLECIGFRSD